MARRSTPDPLDDAMYVADLPPQAWIGIVLFIVSGLWAVFGNLFLTSQLQKRGAKIPFMLQGSTIFMYFRFRPRDDPRRTDRIAASVAVAVVVLVATVYFLGPYIWPANPPRL